MSEIVRGVGVSPGMAIGSAFLLRPDALPVVPAPIPPERVEQEIQDFQLAREVARGELNELRERVTADLGDHYAGIFGAQLLILDDADLVARTESRIRVGRVSAAWALKEVVGEFTRRFDAMENTYLQQRGGDLSDIHHRLQRILRGAPASTRLPEGNVIVVARNLVPSDAVTLVGRGVVGLATDEGGRTSHTAILAQALGVPAVAGLRDISLRVRPGERIILDGTDGAVRLVADEAEAAAADERRLAWLAREAEAAAVAQEEPARTRDGVEIVLRANIEFPQEVDTALRFGAAGIGLYRSEFLFLSRSPDMPTEEEHYRTYLEIARRVAPHPAVIRTLDLGGEKYFHEVLDRGESNPVLGLRAVRLCLQRPDIFRPQLRGLLRASPQANLRIMLPLVTTPEEVRSVRRLLDDEARSLAEEGVAVRSDVALGVMIEVPAAALAADILAHEADFFSIGTNDLFQYALAVDRGNEAVNYLYQPSHPGVLRMLKFIVDSAGRQGIPVSLCGEMGADPELTGLLVGLGLRELSVQPRALPAVRAALAEVDSERAREETDAALEHPAEVEARRQP